MKTLVLAPQPFFTPRGTPFSVYYRALVTSELGIEVDILTYGQGQDVSIPHTRILRIPNITFWREIRIGPSVTKLVLDVLLLFRFFWQLIVKRYDVVHAHEEAIFFAVMLKPLFRYKLVYDMHSSLPQQLSNFNFCNVKWVLALFTWLERWSLKHADAVITICPDLADQVTQNPTWQRKHRLIENSVFEPVQFRESNQADGAPSLDEINGLFDAQGPGPVLCYAGTLEVYQGIDLLLRAFEQAQRELPQLRLVIVGGSAGQIKRYKQLSESLALELPVTFTGCLPPALAHECNQRADILLSPRISGTNTPLKIYEQLASGKPLVATRIHSHTQVLNDDVAFLAEPEVNEYAKALLAACRDHREAALRAEKAVQLYEQAYSRARYREKLESVFGML